MSNFNPTLVRLRRTQPESDPCCTCNFNPTLVRLRPDRPESESAPESEYFNPTLVRLRRADNPRDIDFIDEISIPRWFD